VHVEGPCATCLVWDAALVLLPCCHGHCRACLHDGVQACGVCGSDAVAPTAHEPPSPPAAVPVVAAAAAQIEALHARLAAVDALRDEVTTWHARTEVELDAAFAALAVRLQQRHAVLRAAAATKAHDMHEALTRDAGAARQRLAALTAATASAQHADRLPRTHAAAVCAHLLRHVRVPVPTLPSPAACADSSGISMPMTYVAVLDRIGELREPRAAAAATSACSPKLVRATLSMDGGTADVDDSDVVCVPVDTERPTAVVVGERTRVDLTISDPAPHTAEAWLLPPTAAALPLPLRITRPTPQCIQVHVQAPAPGTYTLHLALNGRRASFVVRLAAVHARRLLYPGHLYGDGGGGILHHIATAGGRQPWRNPDVAGLVTVSTSAYQQTQCMLPLHRLVAHKPPTDQDILQTDAVPYAWMAVELHHGRSVRLAGYALSIDGGGRRPGGEQRWPRHWRLQASVGGKVWRTLSVHSNDSTLSAACPSAYFALHPPADPHVSYSHVRIVHDAPRTILGVPPLCVTGLELYGDLLDPADAA
jgi:hypothetical protein